MEGFSGPFDYSIDGIIHSWDNLDDLIKKELKASKFTKENSLIYLCKVCVCQSDVTKQKNHDWLKIKRIFINIGIPNNSMHIIGIHPTDRERGHSNKTELPLIKSVKSEVSLFKMLQFKLSVNGIVKSFSQKDRYSVMANFNRRQAQWVFSDGWEKLDYSLYLYIVVPKSIKNMYKYIEISIKSALKGNKVLNNLTIWKHRLEFINYVDLKQDL